MENDLLLTYGGGAVVSDDGDLKMTSDMDALSREISRRLRTTNPAWKHYPLIGVGLEDFAGEANTRELALEITKHVNYELNKDNIAYPGSLFCRVVPVDDESCILFVFMKDQTGTMLIDREVFAYSDGIAGHLYDPEEATEPKATGIHSVPKNPYLRKI